MFRLIALYIHYRDLQEERARGIVPAVPTMRIVPTNVTENDDRRQARALAA